MRETAQDSADFIIDAHQKRAGVHLKSVFKGQSNHIVWHVLGGIMCQHLLVCKVANPEEQFILNRRKKKSVSLLESAQMVTQKKH